MDISIDTHEPPQRGPATRPGLRVLVVDDEDAARIATRRFLEYCGHRVEAAATVSEAIEKADLLLPDVLVCDWKLAGKRDGTDVARILREKYGVAIIFITAYALSDLRRHISDLGAVDCLRKPISLTALAAVVESAPRASRH